MESLDEPLEPTAIFTGGPYLHVALPDDLRPLIPLNASSFIREWELSLDPVELLRFVARHFLIGQGWLVADCYAVPTWETLPILKTAPQDDGLIQAFSDGTGDVRWDEDDVGVSIRDLITETPSGGLILSSTAQPILLGLAVASTMEALVGKAGRWLHERWEKDTERRERRRPSIRNELAVREETRYTLGRSPD